MGIPVSAAGVVVPYQAGRHGGTIRAGSLPGTNAGGAGRTPEAIRQSLREMTVVQAVPFLAQVMEGRIEVQFIGQCPRCQAYQPLPEGEDLDTLVDACRDAIRASVDHRLKATAETMKYALPVKADATSLEEHPEWQSRIGALRQALVELCGEELAGQVITRAMELSA